MIDSSDEETFRERRNAHKGVQENACEYDLSRRDWERVNVVLKGFDYENKEEVLEVFDGNVSSEDESEHSVAKGHNPYLCDREENYCDVNSSIQDHALNIEKLMDPTWKSCLSKIRRMKTQCKLSIDHHMLLVSNNVFLQATDVAEYAISTLSSDVLHPRAKDVQEGDIGCALRDKGDAHRKGDKRGSAKSDA